MASIFDWEMYFRKHKFFPKNKSKSSKDSIDYNKMLGLSQKTIASVIASWREQNLGY